MRGMREYVFAGHDELGARGHGVDLRAARQFELIHGVEGLLDGRPPSEEAVVAHNDRIVRPEILDNSLSFVELHRRPLVVVLAYVDAEHNRDVVYWQPPAVLAQHR